MSKVKPSLARRASDEPRNTKLSHYFYCLSLPDVGWAVPTNPQPIVVGTAHPTGSQTVELLGLEIMSCGVHVGLQKVAFIAPREESQV